MPSLRGKITAAKANKIQIDFQASKACADKVAICPHRPQAWRILPLKPVWFVFDEPATIGERVEVAISKATYQRLLLRLYGLPLLALWLGAGIGEAIGAGLPGGEFIYSLLTSIGLFAATWQLNFLWPSPEIHIQKLKD